MDTVETAIAGVNQIVGRTGYRITWYALCWLLLSHDD